MAVVFKSPQMCHCYVLYLTKLRIFFMISYVPCLWTAQATGTKGIIFPLCNNTVFRLRMEDSMNNSHSSGLHLMFIAAVRYATILQTLSLLCFRNNCSKHYFLDCNAASVPLLKFGRKQFWFFLRQCSVSDKVTKFLLRDLGQFNKFYVREKLKISATDGCLVPSNVPWMVTLSYVIPSVTEIPEPILNI